MDEFFIKRGDTSPAIKRQLYFSSAPLDLTGAEVVFSMRNKFTRAIIIDRGPCDIDTSQPGTVIYYWADGDTAVGGCYEAEFEVTYADGAVETAPNNGFIAITITEDIA